MMLYCINLEHSIDRRSRMQGEFGREGLGFEFLPAIDGRVLAQLKIKTAYSKWRTRFCYGRGLSRGEIGCALSHIEFYKRVIANNAPGFVFEDDVELGAEVKDVLEQVDSFLANTNEPCLVQVPGLMRDMPQNSEGDFVKVSGAMGTYAYGVNPSAAALLLKAFSPIKFPIDYYGYLIKHYGLNFYVYNGMPISVDMVSESTVGTDRFKVDVVVRNVIGLIFYKLWRLFGKSIDVLLRMISK